MRCVGGACPPTHAPGCLCPPPPPPCRQPCEAAGEPDTPDQPHRTQPTVQCTDTRGPAPQAAGPARQHGKRWLQHGISSQRCSQHGSTSQRCLPCCCNWAGPCWLPACVWESRGPATHTAAAAPITKQVWLLTSVRHTWHPCWCTHQYMYMTHDTWYPCWLHTCTHHLSAYRTQEANHIARPPQLACMHGPIRPMPMGVFGSIQL